MQWTPETWSSHSLKQTDSRTSHSGVSAQGLTHALRSTQGASTVQNPTPHVPVACRYPYYNNNLDPTAASFAATYHEDFSAWNSFDLATHQQRAFHFASTPGAGVNPSQVMSFAHLPGHRSTAGYTFGVASGELIKLCSILFISVIKINNFMQILINDTRQKYTIRGLN